MRDIQVLLVEDKCSTCALLRAFCDQADGLTVCGEAHDGWEGLELLREKRPDLVLLDLIMPGMDGLEFLRAAAGETGKRPKVIVLSGVVADEYVQQACRLGASYYLVKPVNLTELAGRIDTLFPKQTEQSDPGLAAWALLRLGADRESLGYRDARYALGLLAEDGGMQMKKIYLDTAEAFSTTYSRVEKNLRTLIKNIHKTGGGFYEKTLGFADREKPPDNGSFLRALAEEIRKKK